MKKNVIMICIDGCRLDRAKRSDVITKSLPGNAFCSETITYAPYTNSSLFAVFTGTYGNRNGCYSYWHSLKFKKNQFKTITKYLQDNNYFTFADVHSKLAIPQNGFDEFHIYDESKIDDLSIRHGEILETVKSKIQEGNNFFLYLHYESIHTGIMNSVLKVYNNFSKEYFDNRKLNERRYDQLFNNAEDYLKKLFVKIEKLNLFDDTLLVIFSDHGISVGEKFGERAYGAFCYDYTIKTFCCFSAKEFPKTEIKQQIRHIDITPTILDYLGIKEDTNYEKFDGRSLLPLINGKSLSEEIAFTETGNPLNEKRPPMKPNTRSVRTSEWKLISNEYNNTEELYNLQNDPDETNNLINTGLLIEGKLRNELLKIEKI